MTFVETLQNLKWADYLYCLLFDNERLSVMLEEGKPFLPATIVFPVIHALFVILSGSVLNNDGSLFFIKLSYGFISLSILWVLVNIFVTCLSSFTLSGMKIRPDMMRIFSIINLSYFPRLFVLPITVFLVSIHPENSSPGLWSTLSSFVLTIYSIVITVKTICFLHKTTMMKSFLSVVMSLFFAICALLLVAVCASMIMFYMLSQNM
ncbi:MAG TPA: hypothetical protein P5123_03470 [Spirochaetota bacterium]|nr:hypothetical protein [Spirochaetota bacterium]